MNEKEVKEKIGESNWASFQKWMYGQTTGVTKDGKPDYFEWDVNSFVTMLSKKEWSRTDNLSLDDKLGE
jgi:hypothetical protein